MKKILLASAALGLMVFAAGSAEAAHPYYGRGHGHGHAHHGRYHAPAYRGYGGPGCSAYRGGYRGYPPVSRNGVTFNYYRGYPGYAAYGRGGYYGYGGSGISLRFGF